MKKTDRRRHEPEPGSAPAAGYRPCSGRGSAGADPRRGNFLHRHPHRKARAGRHGRPDVWPHDLRHCPPPVHGAQLGLHHGVGAGPHHRARHPRRADCPEGPLLSPVHRQFCREQLNRRKRSQNSLKSIKTAGIASAASAVFVQNAATAPKS